VAALSAEVSWLTRAVHADPGCHATWHLLALVSLQLAVATGQSKLYRASLVRCKVAVAQAKREFAECEAAVAAAAPPAAPGGPPGFAMPGLPPGLQMAMGGAAAVSPAAMAKAAEAKAARTRVALMVLRLLAATSECLLHSRLPRAHDAAKEAATDTLRWALQQGLDASLAHRQLARCHAAARDMPNATQSAEQAAKGGDLLALLEGAHLAAAQPAGAAHTSDQLPGGGTEGARNLAAMLQAKAAAAAPWEQGLLGSAQLLCAVRLLAGGDAAAARDCLVGALELGQLSSAAAPVAHVLQSMSAAVLAQQAASSGEDGKKMQLEARWAAATAVKELGSTPEGGACVVLPEASVSKGQVAGGLVRLPARSTTAGAAALALAEAEALRGKNDKALEAAMQALKAWPTPPPAEVLHFTASLETCQGVTKRTLAAKGVHAVPWDKQMWSQLQDAAVAT